VPNQIRYSIIPLSCQMSILSFLVLVFEFMIKLERLKTKIPYTMESILTTHYKIHNLYGYPM
jgi:hypothetical protein